MSEYVSELAKALSARERRAFEFDTAGFLGLGGAPLAKLKIRVATKAEQDRAVLAAYKYIADLAATVGLDAAAAADRDLLVDAKTCHILFAVCRDANNPAYPAFPGPKWMMDHLSADELAVLLSCYAEALSMTGTIEMDLSAERLDGLVTDLAASAVDGLGDPQIFDPQVDDPLMGPALGRVPAGCRRARSRQGPAAPSATRLRP